MRRVPPLTPWGLALSGMGIGVWLGEWVSLIGPGACLAAGTLGTLAVMAHASRT